MVTNGGREKASLHHDSQSNEGVGSGKGSETICFLGVQSKPRGFLTTGSWEFDSDRRLFRERGGGWRETTWVGVGDRGTEWGVCSSDGALDRAKTLLDAVEKRETVLTIDVYETGMEPDGSQMGAPNGIVSASVRAGKRHRRCPRSRWNVLAKE